MDGLIYASQEEADADAEKAQKATEKERQDKLVKLARERFTATEDAESEIRRLADEDIRFRAGEQWDLQVLNSRKIDRRPALVINRMPQFERQITNEQRQSKPAIQVSPVDSDADPETAEMLQGLIRHVEYDSSADVAYDTAITSAVRGGYGYIRIVTEYESEDSFDQCAKIKRVRDPFSIYFDPYHQEPDGSDANFAFVVDDGISEEEFKAKYPDAEPVKGGWGSQTSNASHTCQVVEYFYKERIEDELLVLQPYAQDPTTGKPALDPQTGHPIPVGPTITVLRSEAPKDLLAETISSRPTHRTKVCWVKIAGSTVVEETEFPSKWIPIVPVLGDELWVNGKRILEGIIRNARDAQRMYNYWTTAITETIALTPKAPYIGYEGQFAGHEKQWAEASSRNTPYLEVRTTTVDGKPAPLPTRNAFDAPIGGMIQAMQFAADDMKNTTGIYDSALGAQSNEKSGVAIRARQGQSQTSTMHFSDNLARGLKQVGHILIDVFQRIYTTASIRRILGEDGTPTMVAINGAPMVQGQERMYDLNVGRYDVTVSMGASYASKRQETVAALLELSRSNPKIAEVIADIMVRNMDWPGAAETADRLKKMLPPGVAEPDKKQKVDPAVLMNQLQQSQQMISQLTQAVHAAHNTLDGKTLELQSAERKDLIIRHSDMAKAFATADPTDLDGRGILLEEMKAIERRLDSYFPPAPETSEQAQPPAGPPPMGPPNPPMNSPQGVPQ